MPVLGPGADLGENLGGTNRRYQTVYAGELSDGVKTVSVADIADLPGSVSGLSSGVGNLNTTAAALSARLDLGDYVLDEERWTGRYWVDGKKIYRKVISTGQLPVSGAQSVPLNITNVYRIFPAWGFAFSGTQRRSLPYLAPDNPQNSIGCTQSVDGQSVSIRVGSDQSAYTESYVVAEYICTDR